MQPRGATCKSWQGQVAPSYSTSATSRQRVGGTSGGGGWQRGASARTIRDFTEVEGTWGPHLRLGKGVNRKRLMLATFKWAGLKFRE
jgi:hypothetical protein